MAELLLGPTPHTEAVAFLKNKPALSRGVFEKLLPEIKARTFAVAGIEPVKALQSLRDRIADLPAGGDWESIKKDLVNEISPFIGEGEEGEAAAERRAELLLRTHGYQAYAASQYQVMNAQRDVFPFWRYQTAQDDRVRDAHAALDGVVLPCNDAFWQTHFPPWDYNCRCTVVPLSKADHDEIAAEDKTKPADQRSILTDDQRDRMRTSGQLVRGPSTNVDVRAPREKGRPDGYAWQPGDLRLPIEELKKRYDAPTWAAFESFATSQSLGDGRTVWSWLQGEELPGKETPISVTKREKPTKEVSNKKHEDEEPIRSKPVSQALDVQAGGAVGQAVKRSLKLIDQAHDDGVLPSIPVIGRVDHPTAQGTYLFTHGGAAKRIAVRDGSQNMLITAAHELGHFIDHQALDVAGQFASESSPSLAAWRTVVRKSTPLQGIKDRIALATPKTKPYFKYLADPTEIWARAYAQYIATRTGDATMLAEIAAIRSLPKIGPLLQWTPEEFVPIAQAIDNVFKAKGWIL